MDTNAINDERAERRARATQGPLRGPAKPARIPSGDRRTYSFVEGLIPHSFDAVFFRCR